jgi:sulfate/thiosulfate-binding protein
MNIKLKAAAVGALTGVLALSACSASGDDAKKIELVAYSTPQSAFEELQELFKDTPEGDGVSFTQSYGSSGDQSRAVEAGQPADLVNFSLESDVTRLIDADLVADDWKDETETGGILADSVVVFVVREGNPKNIQSWEDLVKPGIGIVSANPFSSGGARWNMLAAWGSVTSNGGTEADAEAYLTDFFKNAVSLPGSARDALTAFTGGTGDVLISYENEAILARQNGEPIDYLVPDETILIETPVAVCEDAPDVANDFLDFLFTPEAQTVFVESGYRSVIDGIDVEVEGANDPANPFPTPETLLTIDGDFGGWAEAHPKFFDPEEGIVSKFQIATGTTE